MQISVGGKLNKMRMSCIVCFFNFLTTYNTDCPNEQDCLRPYRTSPLFLLFASFFVWIFEGTTFFFYGPFYLLWNPEMGWLSELQMASLLSVPFLFQRSCEHYSYMNCYISEKYSQAYDRKIYLIERNWEFRNRSVSTVEVYSPIFLDEGVKERMEYRYLVWSVKPSKKRIFQHWAWHLVTASISVSILRLRYSSASSGGTELK